MVELRQRVPQKRKSPSPDSQKNSDASGLMLRRSGRKSIVDFDETKYDQKVRAAVDDGVLVISGLTSADFVQRPTGGAAEESEDTNNGATWETKWLESPTKRRRLDRSVNGHSQSPVASSRGRGSSLREVPGRSTRQNAAQPRARSDDEAPRTRRSRLSDSILSLLRRSRTNASQANQSKETSQSATPIKSVEEAAETTGNVIRVTRRTSQGQQLEEAADNLSSGRSTPAEARSPALSSIPSPGPPDADDFADGETAVSKDPDDLGERDLPPAFLPMPPPSSPSSFPDVAAHLLSKLYAPISQPHRFTQILTSHSPSSRSTETLWALAINTQKALKVWQDEYILLDKKTAPVALPIPKKPATGGRVPVEPSVFEAEKHKELYNEASVLAAAMGIVFESSSGTKTHHTAPVTTDHGSGNGVGRELRRRKAEASVVDGLGISSDDAGGRGTGKRTRRPARRFEIGQNGMDGSEADVTPATRGVGTRRRRGGMHPAVDHDQNGTLKRGRIGALLREESAGASSMSATPESEEDGGRGSSRHDLYQPPAGPRGGRGAAARRRGRGNSHAVAEPAPASTGTGPRRQKAKSEKRSESMTLWWAARKKKAAEEKIRQMRERGEIHGPSEGIMDTSSPVVTKSTQSSSTASYMPASTTSSYRYPNLPASSAPAPGPPKREYSWHQHNHRNSFIAPPRTGPLQPFPQYHSALDQISYASRGGGMSPGNPSTTGPSYTNSISSVLNNAPPPPSAQRAYEQRQHDDGRNPPSNYSPGAYGNPHYSPGGHAGGYMSGQQPPPHLLHHPPPPPSFLQMQQPPPPHQQQQGYFHAPWGARYPRY